MLILANYQDKWEILFNLLMELTIIRNQERLVVLPIHLLCRPCRCFQCFKLLRDLETNFNFYQSQVVPSTAKTGMNDPVYLQFIWRRKGNFDLEESKACCWAYTGIRRDLIVQALEISNRNLNKS